MQRPSIAWAVCLSLLLSGASRVALPATPEELDEVVVDGYKSVEDHQVLADWLNRLVGRYEISGGGEPAGAQGTMDCIGFRGTNAPAVHCDIKVQWRGSGDDQPAVGGLAALQPAAMLLGYSYGRGFIIRHLLVDSEGRAEGGAGILASADMMVSRDRCLGVPDACERIVRLTVGSDQRQVKLEVAFVIGQRTAQAMTLVMDRQQDPNASGGPAPSAAATPAP